MKILVVGGTGTIGGPVAKELNKRHEMVVAGRESGHVQVDMADTESILKMYESVDGVDAVVSAAGSVHWEAFENFTEEQCYVGIRSKLMGQVNLVRIGQKFLNPGGSFTLTSGILAEDPVYTSTNAAMVNGGLHSFVKAVCRELPGNMRINIVSPGLVEPAAANYEGFFPGHTPVSMNRVVDGYVKSVEGRGTGEVIRVY